MGIEFDKRDVREDLVGPHRIQGDLGSDSHTLL